jgi:hypothetical protein
MKKHIFENSEHHIGRPFGKEGEKENSFFLFLIILQRAAGHMRDDKTATTQHTQQHTFTCFGTHYSFS